MYVTNWHWDTALLKSLRNRRNRAKTNLKLLWIPTHPVTVILVKIACLNAAFECFNGFSSERWRCPALRERWALGMKNWPNNSTLHSKGEWWPLSRLRSSFIARTFRGCSWLFAPFFPSPHLTPPSHWAQAPQISVLWADVDQKWQQWACVWERD